MLDAGKSIAPDKRRKKKAWKRLQISDCDSGSEVEVASDEDAVIMGETISDISVDRSKRAAKREERSIATELKERELVKSKSVSPDLRKLDLKSLQELGSEWLNGIDAARRRSSNLKDDLSGQIKRFVDKSRDLMEVLVSRLSDRGDASFLRSQVTELTAQLRALKCEEEARIREISALKRKVEILRNSMQSGGSGTEKPMVSGADVRPVVSSADSGADPTMSLSRATTSEPIVLIDRLVPSPLPKRPPRVDGPVERHAQSDRDKDPSQSKLELDSAILKINPVIASDINDASIDEILYNLIELRNARRPHVPRIPNPFRDNLTVIPPPDPSAPPKRGRGRPRKIRNTRNKQLTPLHGTSRNFLVSGSDTGGASTPLIATTSEGQPGWSTVVRRRRAKRKKGSGGAPRSNGDWQPDGPASAPRTLDGQPAQKRRRPPRTVAVTITGSGNNFSLQPCLKRPVMRSH